MCNEFIISLNLYHFLKAKNTTKTDTNLLKKKRNPIFKKR